MKLTSHKPSYKMMQNNDLFKALVLFIALGSLLLPAGKMRAAEGRAKVIGYYMDASDDYYKAGFQVFKALATSTLENSP